MTNVEIQVRIGKIEKSIAEEDHSYNRFLMLAGEWQGLQKALGTYHESAWGMLSRVRGL